MRGPVSLAVALALSATASASAVDCQLDTFINCTAGDAYNYFYSGKMKATVDAVPEKVKNATAATTAPDSFAGKLHSSYEDFLKLLAFAVNDVEESEDGKALVVRLNPLRRGVHLLGLSLTISKPSIPAFLSNSLPAQGRADAEAALSKQLGDLDDLTLNASYSIQSASCNPEKITAERCWGREGRIYTALLSDLIPAPPEVPITKVESLVALIPGEGNLLDRQLASDPATRAKQVDAIRDLAEADRSATTTHVESIERAGANLLWPMVDNQPQLAVSVSTREVDELAGQEQSTATVELQFGGRNLNWLYSQCPSGDANCVRERLAALAVAKMGAESPSLQDGKFVLRATYSRRSAYSMPSLPIESPVVDFDGIDLKSSDELKVTAQWGALLVTDLNGRRARVDFSAEGIQTHDDEIRTKSRWIAGVTLTLPLAEGVSIPVSLNYGNKPEFLSDQTETFGAHVGLSYRLPFGDGPTDHGQP